jgi:transposase
MAPLVRRTWAPLGETPILVHRTRGVRKVSVIATLCLSPAFRTVRLFFQVRVKGNITGVVVMDFLKQLLRQLHGPVILIWDRLQAHRCREVQKYVQSSRRILMWYLPPYAPELNPVEYAWCYLKMNPFANAALPDVNTLGKMACRRGRSLSRRSRLLRSFVTHSPLFSGYR